MGPANGSLKARLWAAAIVAGVAAVVVLVVLVFKFGRYDPSPPSLADHPNSSIPGEILYIDRRGCISRVAASGGKGSHVYCPGAGASSITWIDQGTIAYTELKSFTPPTWYKLDLGSKQATDTGISARPTGPNPVSAGGERAVVNPNGDVEISSGELRTTIAHFDVPQYRAPMVVTWSPDGQWLLLSYWSQRRDAQELWVLSRDGKTMGTLADAQGMGPFSASWWIDGAGYLPEVSELSAVK